MKREGEKMPPEEPDPRLIEVASSLLTIRTSRKPAPGIWLYRMAWIEE